MAGLGTDRACGLVAWDGGFAPPTAPLPARRVVPAGTREHSLALSSELWEAGCHRGSQELEVSPDVEAGSGCLCLRPSAPGPAKPQVPPQRKL